MLSNGGLTNIEEAKRTPVQLLESGPAAGALVAAHLGARDGGEHVLAFDMGGTTAKLSASSTTASPRSPTASRPRARSASSRAAACRCASRRLELIEIGAGGGSIAHLDDIGLLKVGPASAGSEPGPAAYGRGGKEPTVTDADFVLGYLNPAYFVGGTMAIDLEAAEAAMRPLAERAGLGVTEPRLGHPRPRQREHGERRARAHRRARQGPPPLRAAVHGRRRPGARLLRGEEAGPCTG